MQTLAFESSSLCGITLNKEGPFSSLGFHSKGDMVNIYFRFSPTVRVK